MRALSQAVKSSHINFKAYSLSFFSTGHIKPNVNFSLNLLDGSKIIIPVSMGRYNISNKKRKEYDDDIATLLKHTASMLRMGQISRVDVLSTADLQRINWSDSLTNEIEHHFFETHKDLLAEQSHVYKWNEWIEKKGSDSFEENYNIINQKSVEGTEWYNLMVKTHQNVNMSSSLEKSLEYQRREYAAVMLMTEYDHLVYTGSISSAWAYMYRTFPEMALPTFIRASFESHKYQSIISDADVSYITKVLLGTIEQALSSPNISKKEKEKLIEGGLSLFYMYKPKPLKKENQKSTFKQNQEDAGSSIIRMSPK